MVIFDPAALLEIEGHGPGHLAAQALRLATAHGISAYDACYVALAHLHSATLITADEKLCRRLDGSPHQLRLLAALTDADLT